MFQVRQISFLPYPLRSFHSSPCVNGGAKSKRRKQSLRVENIHLPLRKEAPSETRKALAHFDRYYAQLYGTSWNSMRLALLSQPRFCAVVNNFGDSEETCQRLSDLGCINLTETVVKCQKAETSKLDFSQEVDILAQEEAKKDALIRSADNDNNLLDSGAGPASMDLQSAQSRVIDPVEKVLSGDKSMSLYDYIPTKSLHGFEEFVEESDYYDSYKKVDNDSGVKKVKCDFPPFPKHLNVYLFAQGAPSLFPRPKPGQLKTLNYYCMDPGSLLPVLALDLKPGVDVLDMCAGPGGKSLLVLQTMYARSLVSNDIDYNRLRRFGSILQQYCGPNPGVGDVRKLVSFSRADARELGTVASYDRILCDVPCFSDRHAVNSDVDNIFHKTRIQNRLLLPKEQCQILKAGLMYLRPGGHLVYSTCTLSPIQNEGVVRMALGELWEETNFRFCVSDMSKESLGPYRQQYRIHGEKEGVNLGNLVVPYLPVNNGPTYFCRITRLS